MGQSYLGSILGRACQVIGRGSPSFGGGSFRALSEQYPEAWQRLDEALAEAYKAGDCTYPLNTVDLQLIF